MKKAVILICLLACSMGSEAQEKISLKNLDLSKVWQEYGTVITEDDTIKLHAPSVAKIRLDGEAERFQTQVGIFSTDIGNDDASLLVQPLWTGPSCFSAKKAKVNGSWD